MIGVSSYVRSTMRPEPAIPPKLEPMEPPCRLRRANEQPSEGASFLSRASDRALESFCDLGTWWGGAKVSMGDAVERFGQSIGVLTSPLEFRSAAVKGTTKAITRELGLPEADAAKYARSLPGYSYLEKLPFKIINGVAQTANAITGILDCAEAYSQDVASCSRTMARTMKEITKSVAVAAAGSVMMAACVAGVGGVSLALLPAVAVTAVGCATLKFALDTIGDSKAFASGAEYVRDRVGGFIKGLW